MSNSGEHGALGSNKPLERVPVPEEGPSENKKEELNAETTSPAAADDGLPPPTKSEEDVVYLREDLRPSSSSRQPGR